MGWSSNRGTPKWWLLWFPFKTALSRGTETTTPPNVYLFFLNQQVWVSHKTGKPCWMILRGDQKETNHQGGSLVLRNTFAGLAFCTPRLSRLGVGFTEYLVHLSGRFLGRSKDMLAHVGFENNPTAKLSWLCIHVRLLLLNRPNFGSVQSKS